MADLAELIEKVKAATGPDRNLDAMIHHWRYDGVGIGSYSNAPYYTASLDAVVSLAEEVLPGWSWKVVSEPDAVHTNCGVIHDAGKLSDVGPAFVASHETPALALLLAILTAKQEASNG